MMLRRKSTKSLARSRGTKSPKSIESHKMLKTTQVVYQPNILNIPNNNFNNVLSPNRVSK